MAQCPLCLKKFQDRRGLHGHYRFVHGFEYGTGLPAKKTLLTEIIRENIERYSPMKVMEREREERKNEGIRYGDEDKSGKGSGIMEFKAFEKDKGKVCLYLGGGETEWWI